MIMEDQSAVIAFLSAPATYGLGEPVEVIRTHISEVFLAGGRAYKMKRAVKLPYVDFSTIERRLEACQDEVSLNSLTTAMAAWRLTGRGTSSRSWWKWSASRRKRCSTGWRWTAD